MITDPKNFIATISPAAKENSKQYKIPVSFTIAEAALESAWGTSKLAVSGKNLFGIKADKSWKGDVIFIKTREFINGEWVMQDSRWRKYPDWLGSMNDHAAFLKSNKRYQPAFMAANTEDFVNAIAAAGYATDPNYAMKILRVIRFHNLQELDHV